MKTNIKSVLGKAFTVEVAEDATLGALRQAVMDAEGIPLKQQRFLILSAGEVDSLPYGQAKMSEFIDDRNTQGRFLRGVNEAIKKLGVKEDSVLLLALKLGNDDDTPESLEDKIQNLYRRVVFDEYVLTVEELRGLNEALVTAKPKGEYDSLVSDLCSCIGRAIFPQPQYQELNIANVYFAIDALKTATDAHFVDSLFDILTGAAKSNIDGMILKMLDKGGLDVARRFVVDRQACNLETFDKTQYPIPHARSKLQRKAIEYLVAIQTNHEPVRAKIADIIYGESFKKDGVFPYPYLGFHDHAPERYLWDEAWKIYQGESKLISYKITLKAIKGVQLAAKDSNGLSDPYFIIAQAPKYKKEIKQQIKSQTIKKTLNPEWDLSKEKKLDARIEGGETCLIQQDLLTSEFMGSMAFQPRLLYAAMKAENKDTLTLVGELESIESKKSGAKFQDVEGWMVVTMAITHDT